MIKFILIILLCLIIYMNSNKISFTIKDEGVRKKYDSLVKIIGKPTFLETDQDKIMNSATWMSKLDKFNEFGKYGGCDYIKILGNRAKKWHPHPADVFVIIGKYINVPEHLFGPIKFASETINIEQLQIPIEYANKYYKSGVKEIALVTGSCASVTISAITVQFVMDMINKYKNDTQKSIELYQEFRNEYDRRIDDYLCGDGITDKIEWFNNEFFEEPNKYDIGERCKK